VNDRQLLSMLEGQRWFARRAEDPVEVGLLDEVELGSEPVRVVDLLAELDYADGDRDFYQLFLRPPGSVDALAERATVRRLVELIRSEGAVSGRDGTVAFSRFGYGPRGEADEVRGLGVEQSHSSVVVDEKVLLKAYRRLEAGVSPELELLHFLASHGFENAPELRGWWSYAGARMTTTLGIEQGFLAGATDGWQLALREVPREPREFAGRIRRLGKVVGVMHAALASDGSDPAFAPEPATGETFSLLAAALEDEIDEATLSLPGDDSAAWIPERADAAREVIRSIGQVESPGMLIREHGDLHLGQVLWAGGDWIVVDFEGEPARPLPERRRKRSPLRDVAGMLRSFDYAVHVAGGDDELLSVLRAEFLEAYLAAVHGAGILPAAGDVERLITVFELEKVMYELRYELAHRPDWVSIPAAGLKRLLERALA
jgi:maltokinase